MHGHRSAVASTRSRIHAVVVTTLFPRPSEFSDAHSQRRPSRLARILGYDSKKPSRPYLQSFLWITAATAISFPIFALVDLANIIMVYLLAVVLVAAKLGQGPSVFATMFGVASFVYFFVPHYYSFVLSDLRYLPTFLVMLLVGLMVSSLTSQLREEAIATQRREVRSQALYLLSRGLAAAESRENVATVVREHVNSVFGCPCLLLECSSAGLVPSPRTDAPPGLTPIEAECAAKALRERTTCDTGNLLFLPMVVANESVGLLCCQGIDVDHLGSTANVRLLEAFANNAAIALHRLVVGDEARATQQRIDQERLRNVMLSSMSHDFRTPLASITGAVTTLIDSADRLDEPTRLDLMHSIREDAEFLERQIRNMLDLTKLESGNLEVSREWHPMDEVVGGAMTRVEKLLEGRRVEFDVSPQLPLVAIDALLIERLLVNLLENAVRYAPTWSPIEVAVHQDGDRFRIQIADRGPGIPKGQHERVFEKFCRLGGLHRATGSGLGLAICKAIAQLHGGRIWVEDRVGGGAMFQVDLPIGDVQPSDQTEANVGGPQ